jgi:predicted O-methyltransferase YrrM
MESISSTKINWKERCEGLLRQNNYQGTVFKTVATWCGLFPPTEEPIKYLEIGSFHGANAISFALVYGKHPKSEIHCIDPFIDYTDYDEYQGKQGTNLDTFLKNVLASGKSQQITLHRGFSHTEISRFPDEYFDVIYVDGNHRANYVLEDGVLSFRKLKKGGRMVFDDYDWDTVRNGIHCFLQAYKTEIEGEAILDTCQVHLVKK